ncbi:hypothetical protein [Pelagibacterium halotolerans]|uniref:Uncharacterized protein n=1 Tax=Pelagibacterium halotolerans (strain DSM 22347 / JCM 15775 / CGMCC 1.7692 / B2) TaxID=1082931 RepID=G4RC78_PELHB|nr:hypothetical protein [Pelagibacterium halotolerans]AEQ52701.1 hypothetical protein KKY_2693 [Pelagibacterium halotolerans B2]QJR17597.1 hypothetical protein HKM20_03570 [Pelagibacterium halotolerans]SEA84674.1 hypothetical protein SAMN05428936_10995 [Pelagibacterium halotolerans]
MTWANEGALKHAIETLADRYPGENIEIVSTFDIAHAGWECDSRGALIRRDGKPELIIVDQTGGDDRPVREILEAKLDEYEELAAETRNALGQLLVLEGLPRRAIGVEDLTDEEMEMIKESTVEFDSDRDTVYHVAREAMRYRIAELSAEIERLEREIVDVGVEMSGLDYQDRDAIEAAIDKYRKR